MATSDYIPKIPARGGTPLRSPYSGATDDGLRDNLVPTGTANLSGAAYGEDDWAGRDKGVKLQSVVPAPGRETLSGGPNASDWKRGDRGNPGGLSDT